MKNFICFFLLLSLISCSESDDVQSLSSPDDFFALKIGNQWTYKYLRRETADSNVFFDTGGLVKRTITGIEIVDDVAYYKMETEVVNPCGPCVFSPQEQLFKADNEKLFYPNGWVSFYKGSLNDDILAYTDDILGTYYLDYQGEQSVEVDSQDYQAHVNRSYGFNPNGQSQNFESISYYVEGLGLVYRTLGSVSEFDHSFEEVLVNFENIDD